MTTVNNELHLALAELFTRVPAGQREACRPYLAALAGRTLPPMTELEFLFGARPVLTLTGTQARRPSSVESPRTLIHVCMDHQIITNEPCLTTIEELARLTGKTEGTLHKYRYSRSRRDDEFRTSGKPLGALRDGSGATVLWFPTPEASIAATEKELGHPLRVFSDWWPTAAENPLARFTRSRQKR